MLIIIMAQRYTFPVFVVFWWRVFVWGGLSSAKVGVYAN